MLSPSKDEAQNDGGGEGDAVPMESFALKIAETDATSSSENPTKWTSLRSSRGKWIVLLITATTLLVAGLLLGVLLWCLKVYPRAIYYVNTTASQGSRCLPLRVPLCHKHRVPYAYVSLPNRFQHEDQNQASEAVSRYDPLISVKCYSLLPLFLCSLFAPKCIKKGQMVPPCRSLCEETSRKCEFFLRVFSLSWPLETNCSQLPESPDPEVCVGYSERVNLERYAQACAKGFRCDKTRCLPNSWVCDSFYDCQDEADESNCGHCPDNQFYCGSDKCIEKSDVCDGIRDCPNGRDETKCLRLSRNQGYVADGRLEAFSVESKMWLPVCGSNWNTEAMSVPACRMLGYRTVNETRLRDESLPAENRVAVGTSVDSKRQMKTLFVKTKEECEEDRVYVYLKCEHFECGTTALNQAPTSWRIVGGQESLPGSWPWLVALHGGPDEVFFCGGVLISQWWVLSAAHCVGNQTDLQGWTVKLGMTRRTAYPFSTQRRGLAAIVKHPTFTATLYSNDIVMLLLDAAVTFDDFLRPICMPSSNTTLDHMAACSVIGWGKALHDDEADYQAAIHQVQLPIVDYHKCLSWYSSQDVSISDTMLCAGYEEGKKDACQGDSGGPLVCRDSATQRWFVAGVVSWGIKCAQPYLPGIYTNVPMYVSWIERTARQHGRPLYKT